MAEVATQPLQQPPEPLSPIAVATPADRAPADPAKADSGGIDDDPKAALKQGLQEESDEQILFSCERRGRRAAGGAGWEARGSPARMPWRAGPSGGAPRAPSPTRCAGPSVAGRWQTCAARPRCPRSVSIAAPAAAAGNICYDLASEPVVTLCGHLYCWPCLYRWLQVQNHCRTCPVCKAGVEKDKVGGAGRAGGRRGQRARVWRLS